MSAKNSFDKNYKPKKIAIFIDYFKNIFEKSPLLAKVSFLHKPFKNKAHLIEIFIKQFEDLDSNSKKKIIFLY